MPRDAPHPLEILTGLTGRVTSTAQHESYVQVIKEKYTERQMVSFAHDIIAKAYSSDDLDNKIAFAERKILSLQPEMNAEIASGNDAINSFLDELDLRMRQGGGVIGTSTGFEQIDARICGFRGGDLVVVAGRPAMGKSVYLTNIAEHALITQKRPFVIFSLEMPKEQIMERMIASIGGINISLIRNGKLDDQDLSQLSMAATKLKDLPLFIDDKSSISVHELCSKARRIKQSYPTLAGVGVDYLQLMTTANDSREQQVAEISRNLKILAKELNCPVIALSQLNRGLENRPDKRPRLSDLRESGAIEQDADIIQFLYRDEVYNEHSQEKGIAQIITSKFRNGACGTDFLQSELQYSRFRNSEVKETKIDLKPKRFEY